MSHLSGEGGPSPERDCTSTIWRQAVTDAECAQVSASWACARRQALSWAQRVGGTDTQTLLPHHGGSDEPIRGDSQVVGSGSRWTRPMEEEASIQPQELQRGAYFSWSLPGERGLGKALQVAGTARVEAGWGASACDAWGMVGLCVGVGVTEGNWPPIARTLALHLWATIPPNLSKTISQFQVY